MKPWRAKDVEGQMEPKRKVADSHHFDKEKDPDPHQGENLEPDPHQREVGSEY